MITKAVNSTDSNIFSSYQKNEPIILIFNTENHVEIYSTCTGI